MLTRRWLLIAGPVSTYTYDLFDLIRRRAGIETRIIHQPPSARLDLGHDSFEDDRFTSLQWGESSTAAISRFVSETAPEAVLVFGSKARRALVIALARTHRRTPFVYAADTNIAGVLQKSSRLPFKLLAARLYSSRFDAAFALGRTNEDALRLLGFRRTISVPIYSVDYSALESAQMPRIVGERLRVLCVARLVPEKNLVPVVEALVADQALSSQLSLELAGDGPDRATLEQFVARTGPHSIRILGTVPHWEIGALYARSDVLLLPSTHEPWGIVVTEALGLGLPVIATPTVGAAASLAGQPGGIILSHDASATSILEAMRRFLLLRDAVSCFAIAARPVVRARYARDQVADAMVAAVDALLRERSTRRRISM